MDELETTEMAVLLGYWRAVAERPGAPFVAARWTARGGRLSDLLRWFGEGELSRSLLRRVVLLGACYCPGHGRSVEDWLDETTRLGLPRERLQALAEQLT